MLSSWASPNATGVQTAFLRAILSVAGIALLLPGALHTHTSLLWFREDSAIDAQPVYSVLEVVPTMTEVETEMLADMDADSPFGLSYFSETGQMENQHQQCCHLMMASSTCFLVELDVQPKVGTF